MFDKIFSKKKSEVREVCGENIIDSDDLYRGQTVHRVFNEEDRREFVRRVVKSIPEEDLSDPLLIGCLVENVLDRLGYWEPHTSVINRLIQDEIKKRVLTDKKVDEEE